MVFPPIPLSHPDPEGVIRPAPSTCRSAPNRERPSVLRTDKHPHPSGRIRFLSRLGGRSFTPMTTERSTAGRFGRSGVPTSSLSLSVHRVDLPRGISP